MVARARSRLVAGLDVGSSKVACFVAELEEGALPRIIGYGQQPSHGMKRGMIVDMDKTETAIREAVNQAEEMAAVQVQSVYVGLGGIHLRSHMSDGLFVLNQQEIDDSDLEEVIRSACAKQLEGDRQIILHEPSRYILDDQTDIRDPRGMTGSRLEAVVNIVSAPTVAIRNLTRCVERCNLSVVDVVPQPYASSLASLVPDERDLGVCLVDIGGGTCDIAIFAENALQYTAVVPVGGNHITGDIAQGLSTPLAHAERIKTKYGCAMASEVQADDHIDVPHVGEDAQDVSEHITKSALSGIIQPRCEEMLEMIRDRIEQSGYEAAIGRRVVLTGGGSQLTGLRHLAEVVLDKSVRVARPVGVEGLTDLSGGGQFATVCGLVLQGTRQFYVPRRASARGRTAGLGKITSGVRNWLKESFQAV